MANLYELTNEFNMLLSMAADEDVDDEAFADTLEGLDFEIEVKADGYAKVIKSIEADANGIAEEIRRLQKRKQSFESKVETLKKNLEKCMRDTGKVKFKTELFSFGIQKNPKSLVIDDENLVPPEFLKIETKPDKAMIKGYIELHPDVDWARFEQKEGLRIR